MLTSDPTILFCYTLRAWDNIDEIWYTKIVRSLCAKHFNDYIKEFMKKIRIKEKYTASHQRPVSNHQIIHIPAARSAQRRWHTRSLLYTADQIRAKKQQKHQDRKPERENRDITDWSPNSRGAAYPTLWWSRGRNYDHNSLSHFLASQYLSTYIYIFFFGLFLVFLSIFRSASNGIGYPDRDPRRTVVFSYLVARLNVAGGEEREREREGKKVQKCILGYLIIKSLELYF